MTKKSIFLITIFIILVSYAMFSRSTKSDFSSTYGNCNIKNDTSLNSNNTIKDDNSSSTNSKCSNTHDVNEQNINNKIQKKDISISNYLDKSQCINYKLKQGETLTDIARKYKNTCNLNSTVKMIKSINKINDENNIDAQTVLSIPENTLKNGRMYNIITGDTWYKIANQYYSQYNTDSVMIFLVYINNLPNNDLPLGESIFLPSI